MGKYYVAGIPFDSENSLKHYGVKGMEWNKHKFGIDADDRYIKWLKNAGQNIGRFGANVAQNVAKGVTNAARTAGTAVNKGANFVTGNQNRQQYQNQSAAARMMRNPQQAQQRATNYYNQQQAKTLPGIVKTTAQNVGKAIGTAAGNARDWSAQAAKNAGNWAGEAAQKAADIALWPATREGVVNAAQNVGNAVSGAAQNVGGSVQNAVQNVGNTVGDLARNANNFIDQNITGNSDRARAEGYQKIADDFGNEQYAQKAQNAQEQADNSLFGRIGNAANAVGNWFGDRAQDVSQVTQNVGNWVGDRVQDVGNAVSPVAQNVSNAVGQAAQNVSDTVSDAANKATEGAKGFLNSAGQWVNGAVNNVKNTVSKAASDTSNGAKGFLNSAGKWVSNATGNVGKAAQDAGKAVSNAAKNVGNTVGQAAEQTSGGIGGLFDRVGNAVGGAANAVGEWVGDRVSDARDAITAPVRNDIYNQYAKQRDAAYDEGLRKYYETGSASYFPYNPNSPAAQAIDQAWDQREQRMNQVNQHPISSAVDYAAGNVADWARNAAGNVGNWAGQAAQDVGGAVQNAGDWVGDRARDVGGAVGGAINSVRDTAQGISNLYTGQEYADKAADLRRQADRYRESGDKYYDIGTRQIYDSERAEPGQIGRLHDLGTKNADKGVEYWQRANGKDAMADYADQMYNHAPRQRITSAAKSVGDAVSGAAGNAADWAHNTAGNVGDWAGQAVQNVGNFANREFVQPFADLARAYGLDRMDETSGWYGRATQGPPLVPAAINWVRNNNPFVRHDALNEKPDGVSDAFWEKFTADGGTREEYERDWR